MRLSLSYIPILALIALFLLLFAPPARGGEVEEFQFPLEPSADEAVTTSRFPRPISRIAENITVITAQDIVRINAHTLAEVLQTVPGIQLDQLQTPGSSVFFTVLGSTSRHILVQLDGVPLNFLSADNLSEIGDIPVQMIERVEVIKGAASAAWGSSLGGVINIITKSPALERPLEGLASASLGERSTGDLRGELTGTVDRLGYYLTGGILRSDGLTPGSDSELKHGFGKITFDLPSRGKITLGVEARDNDQGLEHSVSYDIHNTGEARYLNGYLNLRYPLAERLTLELNGRGGRRELACKRTWLSSGTPFLDAKVRETFQGFGAGIEWGDAESNLSAGVEYEHNDLWQRDPVTMAPYSNFDLTLERWSGYLNGTYSIGRLSILPGLRYDHMNQLEDAASYTLGATFRLTDDTVLRAYAARGYSMPVINTLEILNGKRQLQNIWTVQAGFESSAIPYLWLKGTFFYNNVWNIQTFSRATITLRDQIREGVDLEFRTSPFYGLALTGGYTYSDAWDKDTGEELTSGESGPRHGAKIGVNYDNAPLGLSSALTGNYVDWYEPGYPVKDHTVIWDLHLTQKLSPRDEMSPEIFFSAHNIFNGSQYQIDLHTNNPRWFEGGMRYRF